MQAGHAKYAQDMQQLTGSHFNHDDSVNDRTPGMKLENNYIATTKLWEQTFNQVRVL